MDDNNWDLGAVVRSCNINRPNNVIVPSIGIESMPFENDDDWKLFDGLLDDNCDDISFKGSVEMFSRNFPVAQRQKPNDQSSSIIHPTNPLPIQLISQPIILPPPPPAEQHAPTVTTQQLINRQQQLVERALLHPTLTMPSRTSLIQTRRRKNQLIKIIYELRQEELLDDTWAWRKYGQKPIKTSPFPRNYYRCSTSKSCRAKKHIEKSPKAENLFVVAYSGEHNHPPPLTNDRSCLTECRTGGAKNKLPKGINIVPRANFSPSSSNRSQRCSSVSPINSTIPTLEIKSASPNKNKMVVTEKKGDEEEKIILISNKFASEDTLKSFEELKGITCNKCGSST